jgi:branched-chain amino acid transport system ATP-binding protein
MLRVENLRVVYARSIEAVRNVSLVVQPGSITTLLGSNGAGKSTVLKAISGVLFPEDGKVMQGNLLLEDESLLDLRADDIVRRGVVQVPEGRRLFIELTVEQNLRLGAHTRSRGELASALERAYELFPRVREKQAVQAGLLSGGEQQMVAIARALLSKPKVLLLDEPSLGLAPIMISEIYKAIKRAEETISVLLVEQNASLAFQTADYAYIMESGRVVLDGQCSDLANNKDVQEFYLGIGNTGAQKSMRDVKHYKRRKRWMA